VSISVLWVTRNRCKELVRSIESVLEQTRLPDELVVIDNASEDDSVQTVSSRFPQIKIIRLHRNIGCPSARNVGVANCTSEIIYFLDDDGWLNPNALEKILPCFAPDSTTGAAMSRIIHISENGQEFQNADNHHAHTLNNFNGGSTAIRKKAFLDCGGFPDDFFRQVEEVALSLYLMDKGYEIIYEPTSIMYHRPSNVERFPVRFAYYVLRNSIRIGYRQIPFPYWLGKVFIQLWHAIRLAISHRSLSLVPKVATQAVRDIPLLFTERKPVSRKSFEKFLFLNKNIK